MRNTKQHWMARIRQELGYTEPVAIKEDIRQTVRGERENPPAAELNLAQFDYAAEDAALRPE
jgi:hypothetical protein